MNVFVMVKRVGRYCCSRLRSLKRSAIVNSECQLMGMWCPACGQSSLLEATMYFYLPGLSSTGSVGETTYALRCGDNLFIVLWCLASQVTTTSSDNDIFTYSTSHQAGKGEVTNALLCCGPSWLTRLYVYCWGYDA